MTNASPSHSMNPKNMALLVIDVQRALFSRPHPIHDADELLHNVNTLINMWDSYGGLVVYIQHSNDKLLVKSTPDWELHQNIRILESNTWIHKLHGNAFEGTELHQELSSRGIDQVVICGLVTQGCVKATCLGAMNLGYRVVLAKDGHSNYSKNAAEIIEDWNRKLQEDGVEILATQRILGRGCRAA